jgi:hypothetical protein
MPEELLVTPSTIHLASEHVNNDTSNSVSMTNDALLPGLLASSVGKMNDEAFASMLSYPPGHEVNSAGKIIYGRSHSKNHHS